MPYRRSRFEASRQACLALHGGLLALAVTSCAATTQQPERPAAAPAIEEATRPPDESPRQSQPLAGSESAPRRHEVFALRDAVRLALANNPSLSEAQWDAAHAAASVEEAEAVRWPTLTASASYQRWLDPQRLVPISAPGEAGTFSHDIVSGDLTAHIPVYTGGATSARLEAQRRRERASQHALERSRQAIVFEVTSLFYEIVGQRRLLEAFEASQQALVEERRVLTERIAVDKAAPVDTLRVDVRIAELDQIVSQARNALALRRRKLATVLGMDPSVQEIDARGQLIEEASRPVVRSGTNVREDVLAAQSELAARDMDVDVARSSRWPEVDARLSYGLRADIAGNVGDVGVAGLFVSVPLLEGGVTTARVRAAQARLHAAEQRLRGLTLQSRLEVEAASLDLLTARERVAVSETAIEQARRAFEIEREKLAIGRGTTTEVLDAHAALINAQAAHFGNLTALSIAHASVAFARGEPVP